MPKCHRTSYGQERYLLIAKNTGNFYDFNSLQRELSMKLPHREKAYIPSPKLHDYLLSKLHSIGKWKAGFFRSLGCDATNVDELEQHLISIAHSEDVREVIRSAHGTKYVVDGLLQAPDGRLVQVRTVWITDVGEDRPRFVTAYPL